MGKKGKRNRMKRIAAPKLWDIMRKEGKFVYKPRPGPHPIESCYPLGVVVRDILHLTKSSKETRYVLKNGFVFVDGKVRKEPSFPVGLFDVVSIPSEGFYFRLVPSAKGFVLVSISKEEASLKLCRVNVKKVVKGGRIQYGTHDGRTFLDGSYKLRPGDTILAEVPSQRIVDTVSLENYTLCMVLSGERAGQIGKVVDLKKGTMTRERMVKISLSDGETEIPARLVVPVGKEKPLITVSVNKQ
jgi:small subunit ribosomal protein S4e